MPDPRELLDRYAARHVNDMGDRLDETVPEVIAALRAVLDLHKPFTLSASTHKPKPVGCGHCCDGSEVFIDYPCPTVQAITTALEATDG